MKTNGAGLLIKLLERQGITTIAGIPGGASLPIYDALHASNIRHVLARHEQGAGFIAQGMARATGNPAVCFGTSGPGATNLLTAIADAKLDSIPIVAITGQVPKAMIGTDAFQEIDTYGLTIPITKHNFLVRSATELLEVVPDAFRIAVSGRPGPVVVDVPKDVQNQSIEVDPFSLPPPGARGAMMAPNEDDVTRMAALINSSERPILMIGAGVVASGSSSLLRAIAESSSIPVASTLHGLGAMPHDHPLFAGMVGMHGARYTNLLLDRCDLLIGLGVRFDDRATGKVAEFCPRAKIIHVDIDRSELGKIKKPCLGLAADVADVLHAIEARIEPRCRVEWRKTLDSLRRDFPLSLPGEHDVLRPYGIIRKVAAMIPRDAIITSDVGQHQMWVAQTFPFSYPRQWLTSGGLGTMGFGLPASIGAALAKPDRMVVCFSGDGSLLMNLQELATAAEERVNVKIILLNNNQLGLVRQQQQLFYGARYHGARLSPQTNFAAIARGFGVESFDLGLSSDPEKTLEHALGEAGPCLINAPIPMDENVYPMVPPGGANRAMIGGGAHDAAN